MPLQVITDDAIRSRSKIFVRRSINNCIRCNFWAIILAAIFVSLSKMRLLLSPDTHSERKMLMSIHPDLPMDSFSKASLNDTLLPAANVLAKFEIHQIATSAKTSHEEFVSTPILVQPAITNLWQNSTLLPEWMKNYLDWHKEQRSHLTESNFGSFRFIIMIARKGQVAGGVTDRLRPLPAFLRIANATNRIFMIHWDRPTHLEEFLLPPQGGLDWRVPAWLEPHLHNVRQNGNQGEILHVAKGLSKIQACVYQSWNYGELYYDKHLQSEEADAKTVLRDLWNIAFTPSPPVAILIEDQYRQMGIVPGEYATAHIRALYAVKKRKPSLIQQLTINALNCASQLRPGGPFYVASDTPFAMEVALAYGRQKNVTVVSRSNSERNEPLHIGHHEVNATHNSVSDFYDTFVDMYIISMTRCVAFGKGGYGRWGLLMGYDNTCHHTHHGSKWAMTCDWVDLSPEDKLIRLSSRPRLKVPLFRPPMVDNHHASLGQSLVSASIG
jgi:hypothetical protein